MQTLYELLRDRMPWLTATQALDEAIAEGRIEFTAEPPKEEEEEQ